MVSLTHTDTVMICCVSEAGSSDPPWFGAWCSCSWRHFSSFRPRLSCGSRFASLDRAPRLWWSLSRCRAWSCYQNNAMFYLYHPFENGLSFSIPPCLPPIYIVSWGYFGDFVFNCCFTMSYRHYYTRYLEPQRTCRFSGFCCSVLICLHEGNHPVPKATNGAGARHLQVGLGVEKIVFCFQVVSACSIFEFTGSSNTKSWDLLYSVYYVYSKRIRIT